MQDYLNPFDLSLKLEDISAGLENSFVQGLGLETHDEAAVKMLHAFIEDTPDGTGETTAVYLFTFIQMKNFPDVK